MHEPIRYTVRIPNPISHYAEIEAEIPIGGLDHVELFLPVWTPGSYLVREYARHIEGLEGLKTRKSRWRIALTDGCRRAGRLKVNYRVYCRELSVRTNYIDHRFALLQGAATFVTSREHVNGPHEVTVVPPEEWKTAVSGMAGAGNRFQAADYDTLVDSPILAGNPDLHEFYVDGKSHLLVNEGAAGQWDADRSIEALDKLVRYNRELWGGLPYDRYVFLNILGEGPAAGGLEHRNSCCLLASRYATRTRSAYVAWLGLASHEYFHTWNVKRLRPMELGPFDLEHENYTRGLWVSEGFTNYYDELILVRTGLVTRDEYLAGTGTEDRARGLSGLIEILQTTPGRLLQSTAQASYDAWIKLYRPDENSPNTSISYYVKGAVIAFLLDAKIRAATGGAKSLDDVMRLAYARHSKERGFTEEQFREAIGEIAGRDLTVWLTSAVDTTEELDYSEALRYFGLRFRAPEGPAKPWLGFQTKNDSGRLVIAQIPTGKAPGFSVEDEILAIDGLRVLPERWNARMETLEAGSKIRVLIARGGQLLWVDATVEEEPRRRWTLELNGEPNAALNDWLGLTRPPT